jgi:hypothetical protein
MKIIKDFYTDRATGEEVFVHTAEIEGRVLAASLARGPVTDFGAAPLAHIELQLRHMIMKEVENTLYKGVR